LADSSIRPVDNYEVSRLANGVTVVSVTLSHTQAVTYSILLTAGSRYEEERLSGVSHFVEHIVFKGTESWGSAKAISEAIEGVGGSLNASTGREIVTYYARVPGPRFEQAVSVISSLVVEPVVEADEVEKERGVILEEIAMAHDDPHSRVGMISSEVTYPDHALGRDIAGTPETLANVGHAELRGYLDGQYVPSSVVVAVAGNREHADVVAAVGEKMGDWRMGAPEAERELTRGVGKGQAVRVENWDSEQANIVLTMPGIRQDDPDRWALSLINIILGDGMSSRLFQKIREEMALAYSVYSFPVMHSDQGIFGVHAGVSPGKATTALEAVMAELAEFGKTVTAHELEMAREYARGRLLLGTEDTRGVVHWIGRQLAVTGKIVTIEESLAEIDGVSLDDIRKVAERVLRPEDYRLAVLGPFEGDGGFESLLAGSA
jgi:predicted Zn-dependent peptidase